MNALTVADDDFHAAPDDHRWWTETCWFSFDQPGAVLGPDATDLSATFYPLFRPNLGVCSLAVYVWDSRACEPWRIPYARAMWHLAMPATPLGHLRLEGLSYDCLEPLQRYRVRYAEADRIDVDLTFAGLVAPRLAAHGARGGHFDQPCKVDGTLRIARLGTWWELAIDCFGMRDRTWSIRPDDRRGRGTGYSYGIRDADHHVLAVTALDGNTGVVAAGIFRGYAVIDGTAASIVRADRRVTRRDRGRPVAVELSVVDELGRALTLRGTVRNQLANHATPGTFTWMSMVEWVDDAGRSWFGQDQENVNFDLVGPVLDALDVGCGDGTDPDERGAQ